MSIQEFLLKKLKKLALVYSIFVCFEIASISTGIISIVYNLRISETTKLITEESKDPFGLEFSFFEEARWDKTRWYRSHFNNNKNQIFNDLPGKSNAIGGLATFLYTLDPFYMRIDFALARISEADKCNSFSRIQTDDLLISAGYSWSLHSCIRCTISSLLGIPTHKDTSLAVIQFGTGHIGLGIQLDAAINYWPKHKHSIRTAARIVGTIPRSTIVNSCDYNYNLGEIIDLFISHHAPFGNHCLEIGYNPTFVFASGTSPSIPALASELNLIRNSYYVAYEYNFKLKKMSNAVELGLSFSSDVIPKRLGQKLIVFSWFSWGIDF